MRHRWPVGVRFAFNFYMHWAQLLLRQPEEPAVKSLSREGVTQGDPLSIVLYGITLVPLTEELRAADMGLLYPFYEDDAAFDSSVRKSAQPLKLLMKRGPDQRYFPDPAKSIFISDTTEKEEAAKREFAMEGHELKFVSSSRYLGACLGP